MNPLIRPTTTLKPPKPSSIIKSQQIDQQNMRLKRRPETDEVLMTQWIEEAMINNEP